MRDYSKPLDIGMSIPEARYIFENEVYPPALGQPFREEDGKYEERVLNFGWRCFIRGLYIGRKK